MRVARVLAPLLGLVVLGVILWRTEGFWRNAVIGFVVIGTLLQGVGWLFHSRSRKALERRGAHRIGPVKLCRRAPVRLSWNIVVIYVLDGGIAYAQSIGPFRGPFRQLYRAGQATSRVPGVWRKLRAHDAQRDGEHVVIRIGEVVPATTLRFGPLGPEDADRMLRWG